MNIFILHNHPIIAAQYHFDKHVNKMIIEIAQLLSTAHRVLDGIEKTIISESGRKQTIYEHHSNELYKATHINHPSAVWIRKSKENYQWAYSHFKALCNEYTYRYNKTHLTEKKLLEVLREVPSNIPNIKQTPFVLAFKNNPKCFIFCDPIKSYRNYYLTKQLTMNTIWSNRDIPDWWTTDINIVSKFANEKQLVKYYSKT